MSNLFVVRHKNGSKEETTNTTTNKGTTLAKRNLESSSLDDFKNAPTKKHGSSSSPSSSVLAPAVPVLSAVPAQEMIPKPTLQHIVKKNPAVLRKEDNNDDGTKAKAKGTNAVAIPTPTTPTTTTTTEEQQQHQQQQQAIRFWNHPSLANIPSDEKIRYLRARGMTDAQLHSAWDQLMATTASTTAHSANTRNANANANSIHHESMQQVVANQASSSMPQSQQPSIAANMSQPPRVATTTNMGPLTATANLNLPPTHPSATDHHHHQQQQQPYPPSSSYPQVQSQVPYNNNNHSPPHTYNSSARYYPPSSGQDESDPNLLPSSFGNGDSGNSNGNVNNVPIWLTVGGMIGLAAAAAVRWLNGGDFFMVSGPPTGILASSTTTSKIATAEATTYTTTNRQQRGEYIVEEEDDDDDDDDDDEKGMANALRLRALGMPASSKQHQQHQGGRNGNIFEEDNTAPNENLVNNDSNGDESDYGDADADYLSGYENEIAPQQQDNSTTLLTHVRELSHALQTHVTKQEQILVKLSNNYNTGTARDLTDRSMNLLRLQKSSATSDGNSDSNSGNDKKSNTSSGDTNHPQSEPSQGVMSVQLAIWAQLVQLRADLTTIRAYNSYNNEQQRKDHDEKLTNILKRLCSCIQIVEKQQQGQQQQQQVRSEEEAIESINIVSNHNPSPHESTTSSVSTTSTTSITNVGITINDSCTNKDDLKEVTSPLEGQLPTLRDAILSLVKNNNDTNELKEGAQMLYLYCVNLSSKPNVPRYRKIYTGNYSFQQKVAKLDGAVDLLHAVGFSKVGNNSFLEWQTEGDIDEETKLTRLKEAAAALSIIKSTPSNISTNEDSKSSQSLLVVAAQGALPNGNDTVALSSSLLDCSRTNTPPPVPFSPVENEVTKNTKQFLSMLPQTPEPGFLVSPPTTKNLALSSFSGVFPEAPLQLLNESICSGDHEPPVLTSVASSHPVLNVSPVSPSGDPALVASDSSSLPTALPSTLTILPPFRSPGYVSLSTNTKQGDEVDDNDSSHDDMEQNITTNGTRLFPPPGFETIRKCDNNQINFECADLPITKLAKREDPSNESLTT